MEKFFLGVLRATGILIPLWSRPKRNFFILAAKGHNSKKPKMSKSTSLGVYFRRRQALLSKQAQKELTVLSHNDIFIVHLPVSREC